MPDCLFMADSYYASTGYMTELTCFNSYYLCNLPQFYHGKDEQTLTILLQTISFE